MSDIVMYIILVLLIVLIIIGLWYGFKINNRNSQQTNNNDEKIKDLKLTNLDEKINELKNSLDTFKNSSHETDLKSIAKLTETANNLKNSSDSINELKGNINNLQSIFYSSKNRGNLGEFSLYAIIEDFLGPPNGKNWEKQKKIETDINKTGYGNPDAIIYNGYKQIIIDSKFPLDNYMKYQKRIENAAKKEELDFYKKSFENDLKKKIQEIKKYKQNGDNKILIMFIPSEAIFSFVMSEFQKIVIHNENIVNFCSPTTLSLMLRLILEDDRKQYLIKHAEQIQKQIIQIADEYRRLNARWIEVKKQFNKTKESAEKLDITFLKIEKKTEEIESPNNNKNNRLN